MVALFGLLAWPNTAVAQCSLQESSTLLKPDDPGPSLFGRGVSLSRSAIAVGDPSVQGAGRTEGAVFVFELATNDSGARDWQHAATLSPPRGGPDKQIGLYQSMAKSTIVVGSPTDSSVGFGAGAAYLYVRSPMGWSYSETLTARTLEHGALFGSAVSMSSEWILVGAPLDATSGLPAGHVYVFQGDASRREPWLEWGHLAHPAPQTGSRFGGSVAISNRTAVVGAQDQDSTAPDAGAAYVYEAGPDGWLLSSVLLAPDGAFGDRFGTVAVHWDWIAVGAIGDDDQGLNSGSVYLFRRSGPGWTLHSKVLPEMGNPGGLFGAFLSLGRDRLVVGAPNAEEYGPSSGVVHEFSFDSGTDTWLHVGQLVPPGAGPLSSLGPVACEGDRVIVGSPKGLLPGAAHLFESRLGRNWNTYCEPSTSPPLDCYPTIQVAGAATASKSSELELRAVDVPGATLGVFFFTHGGAPDPLGVSSGLCLSAPLAGRSAILAAGGSTDTCDGVLELDWSEILAVHEGTDPLLTVPGTIIHGQFVYFPFGGARGAGFSNAVAFYVCP